MADVWKSQAKKFCEVCKVWFADNKVSVEHHERGEKHKNALQRKLREYGKKREVEAKEQAQMNSILAQMDSGALASMSKHGDQLDHGPALPAMGLKVFDPRQFKDIASMAKAMGSREHGPTIPTKEDEEAELQEGEAKDLAAYDARFEGKVWVEANADYGRKYYFHMYNGETTWVKPALYFTAEEFEKISNGESLATEESEVPESNTQKKKRKRKLLKKKEAEAICLPDGLPIPTPFKQNTVELIEERASNLQEAAQKLAQEVLPAVQQRKEERDKWKKIKEAKKIKRERGSDDEEEEEEQEIPIEFASEKRPKLEDPEDQRRHELLESMPKFAPATASMGAWTRVMPTEKPTEMYLSPLTEKYREQERKDKEDQEAREKLEDKLEPKIEFTEKVVATMTKKVKGPIEFKKKTGPKNIRKREE